MLASLVKTSFSILASNTKRTTKIGIPGKATVAWKKKICSLKTKICRYLLSWWTKTEKSLWLHYIMFLAEIKLKKQQNKTKTKTKKHGINITIIILHATYARMSVNVTTVTCISFKQPKPIVESHAFRPPTDKTVPGVQIVECGVKSERWGEVVTSGEREIMRQQEVPSLSPPTPTSSLLWLLTSFCTVPSI